MAQRNTVQQKVIAEQLVKLHGAHPTADEVHRAVSADYPSISKATVYRTLNKMAQAGQALRVCVGNGADRFDDTVSPHYHVICTGCGRVDDVEVARKGKMADFGSAVSAPGYLITGFELLFEGLCPECAREAGAS